jgi:hypothetical protein
MQKSKPESKQAPICTTIVMKLFSLFQNHSTFLNQFLKMKTNIDQRSKYTLIQRNNKIWKKNQGKKRKLNAVLEKENTCWTIRVKTRVFLAMKNRLWLLKKKLLGSNHLLQQTKQKKTESESKDAPRKMHRIRSNKNIVSWKMT